MPASGGVRSDKKPKQYPRPGPSLERPFQVLSGAVIVLLQSPNTVVIPAGGGWPGLTQLPGSILDHLKPNGSLITPGTTWQSGLPEADLPAAQALVLAQALTSVGFISERLQVAEHMGFRLEDMPRGTTAALISTARAYVIKALSRQGHQ